MLDIRAASLLSAKHLCQNELLCSGTCVWLDCCADCPAGLETPDPCRDPKDPVPEIIQIDKVFDSSKPSMYEVSHTAKTKTVAGWLNVACPKGAASTDLSFLQLA